MGKKVDLHATADIACLTTTHADGLSSHLLSRALVMLSVCDVGCGQQCGGRGGMGLTGCSVAPVAGSSICWAWGCWTSWAGMFAGGVCSEDVQKVVVRAIGIDLVKTSE